MEKYEKSLEVAMKDWASSAWDAWAKIEGTPVVEVNIIRGKYLSYMVSKVTEELNVVVEENVTIKIYYIHV